jgi:ABC-2 type transport system permease protein
MAGAFLGIGICMSALTKSQVIAFILSVVICFLFVLSGSGVVLDAFKGWLPGFAVDTIASFSFLTHFESMSKGVLALNNVVYFLITMSVWLFASLVIIENKKAD